MALQPGYTVGDELGRILRLADTENSDRSITYAECGELLEHKISELFPWMNDLSLKTIFDQVKTRVSTEQGLNPKNYCYGLAAAGVKLSKAFTLSSEYFQTSNP